MLEREVLFAGLGAHFISGVNFSIDGGLSLITKIEIKRDFEICVENCSNDIRVQSKHSTTG